MTPSRSLPRLFIGSSTESLDIAYAVQENLEFDVEATVWSQGFFEPSSNTLQALLDGLSRFDFAAFVFTADDTARIRGQDHQIARDNVIFELGLFFGGLGRKRCFFLTPRDQVALHLPSDLLGTTPLTYSSLRSDGNLVAALGPSCNKLRRAFRTEAKPSGREEVRSPRYVPLRFEDYVEVWNGSEMKLSRDQIREIVMDHYSEEFAAQRPAVQRVFAFLDGLSDAVLDHVVDEQKVRSVFERAVLTFWPVAASMLAPANYRGEWWDPPPSLAELYRRWSR